MANFIFDVDGTLVDSYPLITSRLITALKHFNITYDYEFIHNFIVESTCNDFINYVIKNNNINESEFRNFYNAVPHDLSLVKLYPEIKETLDELVNKKHKLFIYSHRGKSLDNMLNKFAIKDYFIEIIDSTKDFKRKPDPDAVLYLISKYSLDKENTYYVGDREIDILCAINAHIKSVLFNTNQIKINVNPYLTIEHFSDLLKI